MVLNFSVIISDIIGILRSLNLGGEVAEIFCSHLLTTPQTVGGFRDCKYDGLKKISAEKVTMGSSKGLEAHEMGRIGSR